MRHYNEYFTYEYLTYINNNNAETRTCKIKIINDYKCIGSFSLYCHHFAKKKQFQLRDDTANYICGVTWII